MTTDADAEPLLDDPVTRDDEPRADAADADAADADESLAAHKSRREREAERGPDVLDRLFAHWVVGNDPLWGTIGLSALLFMVAYYFFHFAHLTGDIHRGYGDSAFDIGLYDQGVWLLSRFHAPFVTLMGRNLFGDHTQFSLLAMVPLYWIRPDATTLLTVQALVMALGAVPVYLLAMRRLNNPAFATVLAAAFLLHPALAQTNLENYHPDSFLIPLLGFALYAAIEDKPRMFVVFSILCLLCKEDVVLILLPIAIWYTIRHNHRVGGIVAIGSIATAVVMTYGVMRSLIGQPTLNTWRIPFGGVGGFFKEVFKKPADVVKYVIASDSPNGRPFYVWQMIAPTGLLFFIAPEIAITTILVLGANVVSTFGYQHQIAYHYSMVILPGLAMGTVYAISRLKTFTWRAVAVGIVGFSALWSAYLWGPFPFSVHSEIPHWSPSYPAVAEINRIKDEVPKNAVISVYYSFAPHLAHRERIYMWPNPFHAVYWNTFKQEGQELPEAKDVQYLMLPPDLQDHDDVFQQIKSQFTLVDRSSNAILYKRKGT